MIVPFTSSYLMVGARVTGKVSPAAELFILPFTRPIEAAGWRSLGEVSGRFALDVDDIFQRSPLFGYAVKIVVPFGGVRIEELRIVTYLQGNPKALPCMRVGKNEFALYAPWRARVSVALEADDRRIAEFDNGLRIGFLLAPSEPRR